MADQRGAAVSRALALHATSEVQPQPDLGRSRRPALHPVSPDASDLIDHDGAFYVRALLEELNLRPAELAKALGIRAQQVHSWLKDSAVRPTTAGAQELLGQLVKTAVFLRALFPEDQRGQRQLWLRQPQIGFKGDSALELLLGGQGGRVLDVLYELVTGDIST